MKKNIIKLPLIALLCSSFLGSTPSIATAETDGIWSGRVNLGGFVTDGNSQKKAVTFDGMAEARTQEDRYRLGGEVRFAEDEGDETENEYKLYGEYDHFISDKMYAGLGASYEVDKIAQLDQRIKVGPYVGYQYYESDPLNLSTRIGLNYISEEFSNGKDDEDLAASWGVDYDQKFMSDNVQLFYKHELNVPVDDTEAFLFESEAGARFPVAGILTGTAQVDFDWDNAPTAGVKEEDVTYSLKLGYEY